MHEPRRYAAPKDTIRLPTGSTQWLRAVACSGPNCDFGRRAAGFRYSWKALEVRGHRCLRRRAVRPWNTPIAGRLGFAGLFMVAIALTGCGTASRVRTADAPVVAVASAMPQRITPPAGTIFARGDASAAVSAVPTVDEATTAVELPADECTVSVEAEAVPTLATVPTDVVVAETEAEAVAVEADAQDRSSDVTVV